VDGRVKPGLDEVIRIELFSPDDLPIAHSNGTTEAKNIERQPQWLREER